MVQTLPSLLTASWPGPDRTVLSTGQSQPHRSAWSGRCGVGRLMGRGGAGWVSTRSLGHRFHLVGRKAGADTPRSRGS